MTEREARLLHRLRDGIKAIEQEIRSIRTEQERSNQNHHIQPLWIEPILSARQGAEARNAADAQRQYRIQKSLNWATWCAFIAAAIYAGIAYCQKMTMDRTLHEVQKQTRAATDAATAAQDSLKLAKESFRQDQRPYVALPGQFTNQPAFGVHEGRLRAMLPIQNYGKSPAIQGRYFGRIAIGDSQIEQLNFGSRAIDEIGIVPPGIQPPIAIYSDPLDPSSVNQTPQAIAGSRPIIMYGRIDYTDMFPAPKPRYALYFCMSIVQAGTGNGKTPKQCEGKNYIE